jgi:subtilisin family serine protease
MVTLHFSHGRRVNPALLFFLLIGLFGAWVVAAPAGAAGTGGDTSSAARTQGAAGSALVEFAAGASVAEARAAVASCQATLTREVPRWGVTDGSRLYSVEAPGVSSRALAAALRALPAVTRAEADEPLTADLTPNDPDRQKQWALGTVWAYSAWGVTTGSSSVVVAVLDTGIDLDHPDLAGNLWQNPGEIPGNDIDDDGNGYVDDINGIDAYNHDSVPDDDSDATVAGHGTHVAGIIGAVGNNALGVTGLGWDTKLMALKCLGITDLDGANADAIECVTYAIDQKLNHGVNVVAINTSWGGDQSPYSAFLEDAVQAAADAGIVWVCSAGNDGHDVDANPRYPVCYDSPAILAVAASILADPGNPTEADDDLAGFSNWGATTIDLAAPGRNIYSTINTGGYGWKSGTSMASPQVAGAIALCAAQFPAETALQRVDRVLTGVDPVASLDGLVASGGRLNIFGALSVTADDMKPSTTAEGVDGDWHAAPVDVTFAATDGSGIGVGHTEYKLDDGDWTADAGAGVSVSTDGSHTVQYRSVDKAGYVEDAQSAGPIKIDATAPEASIAGYTAGWHPGPLEVTLSASDATSGVAGLEYRIGTSGEWTAADPAGTGVEVSGDGVHTLQWRAADAAGNSSGTQERTVQIDSVPLEAQATGADDAWHKAKVTVTVTADDPGAGAGADAILYRLSGAPSWTETDGSSVEIDVPAVANDGTHVYDYRVRDLAGNLSDVKTFTVKIDATPPVSTLAGVDDAWHRTVVTPILTAVDGSGSGAVQKRYRINGGSWLDAPVPAITTQGPTVIDYQAIDAAGNEETVRSATVLMDSVKPTTRALQSTARHGKKSQLKYRVDDAAPASGGAVVTKIVIRRPSGKVAQTFRPMKTGPIGSARTFTFTCKLAKGKYSFVVFASDLADNAATKRVTAKVTVR